MAGHLPFAGPPAPSTGRRAARPRRRASLTRLVTVLALLAGVLVIAPVNQLTRVPSAAAVTADPVIAAAGDMACGQASSGASCREMATSDLMVNMRNTDRLDAVIPLGDVQYECGEIENFMLNDASNPPRGYHRSWGRLKSITRPVVGNHEYRTDPTACLPQGPGAPGYFGYFGQAASPLDANCTASCKGYYSYDLGSWHLITLNSNCSKAGGCGAGSPQETWLRNDLASTSKSCVMAAWHAPRYSTGPRATTSTQALWAALYDAHADVVLNGHEHSYERFDLLGRGTSTSTNPTVDPQGLRQFVVGTGGRNHSSLTGTVLTGSQVRNDNTFGVLKMVLHANSYDWQFVPIPGQTFTDSGSTACHDTGGDTTAPGAPGNLAASAPGATQVNLSWTAATDDVAVTGYEVYRGGALLTTVGAVTSYADTTVAAGTTYSYTVKARDAAGNVGPASNAATVTTPAGPPPGTFLPEADARVQEANPTTNYGASYLRADAGPLVESYLRFTVTGLTQPVRTARLRLFATNGSGDGPGIYGVPSAWSETGVTWATRPARGSTAVDDKATVVANTFVEYDVALLVTGNGTVSFAFAGPSPDATDFNSRETTTNPPQLLITTGGDATAPGAPGNLAASAPGATQVNLSWTAATDDVAVTGYEVYRGGALLTTVGAVTSYADTTVATGTTYSYTVKARDAAGNVGPASNTATVTTPAGPPPGTFLPEADARVQEANPTTNYGTSYLRADAGPLVESYLRFTVTGLTQPVRTARLRLFATNGSANGPGIYGVPSAWSETGVTWATRPARGSTAVDDKATVVANTFVEYDVALLVTGNGTVSFAFAGPSPDATDFNSRETTTNPPQLLITTGP